MLTAFMVCGPSGCGKTTFVNKFIKDHPEVINVSTDAIRAELWGDEADQQHGDIVFQTAFKRITESLQNKCSIIFDATNLNARHRADFIAMCKGAGATYCVCYAFHSNVEDCIQNQNRRNRQVPRSVVRRQCFTYQMPTVEEGWDFINEMEAFHG